MIKTKAEYLRLSRLGLCGNHFRVWDSVADIKRDGYKGWLTVRAREAMDRKLLKPSMYATDPKLGLLPGVAEGAVYFQEVPGPLGSRALYRGWNFEAQKSDMWGGWNVTHGEQGSALTLRADLEQHACHITDPASAAMWLALTGYRDEIEELNDRWPEHVFECSIFAKPVGAFRSRLLIWETRFY